MNKKLILCAPVCALLSVFAASTAHAGDYPMGPSCPEGTLEYTIDWPMSGSYPIPGTTDTVDVNTNGVYLDWSSKVGMDAVIAESGSSGETYLYDPEAYSGQGLSAPIDPWTHMPCKLTRIKFCYDLNLEVEKTAETEFTRTWTWEIDKTADPTYIELRRWETADVAYEIALDAESYDSDFAVRGEITIYNPTKFDAKISQVKDILAGVQILVNCGVDIPYTLGPNQTLVCTYSASLLNADTVENKAIVTTDSSSKVGGDIATAEVKFTDPTEEIDECVHVTDELDGVLQSLPVDDVCADDTPTTIEYTRTFGPLECSEWAYEFTNTATFTTNDTSTEGSDTATVNVKVHCPNGCTRTLGYWATHSEYGPASADPVWEELENGPDTPFFASGTTWIKVFNTPPQGNAYYILAVQYMAAVLNGLADADTIQIDNLLDQVREFFENNTPSSWPIGQKAVLTGWASTLEQFNSGKLGVMHCG